MCFSQGSGISRSHQWPWDPMILRVKPMANWLVVDSGRNLQDLLRTSPFTCHQTLGANFSSHLSHPNGLVHAYTKRCKCKFAEKNLYRHYVVVKPPSCTVNVSARIISPSIQRHKWHMIGETPLGFMNLASPCQPCTTPVIWVSTW